MTKFLNISVDNTLGGASPSDEVVSSQKALKTYIDNHSGGGGIKTNDLFDNKWCDYELNDQNWLRADTFSWQDGTVYSEAYNHLVDDVTNGTSTTETVGSYTITYVLADDGHKITTDEINVANIYNESGVSWYYVLDTTNQRFKLPRENPIREELLQLIRVKGDGKVLGFTDGTNGQGLFQSTMSGALEAFPGQYGKDVGSTNVNGNPTSKGKNLGVTTDSTKSGIIADMTDSTSVYKGKKYLYFYVGQFSQTATEQTAGLNSELFNGKVDLDGHNATFAHIIETYSNGTSWYRIWSDGWCEQGGYVTGGVSWGVVTVNLLKTMADTNYSVDKKWVCHSAITGASYDATGSVYDRSNMTTSSFPTFNGGWDGFYWEVCGYAS